MEELKSKIRLALQQSQPVEKLNAACRKFIERTVLQACPAEAAASVRNLCRTLSLPIRVRAEEAATDATRTAILNRDLVAWVVCLVAGFAVFAAIRWLTGPWIGAALAIAAALAACEAWSRNRSLGKPAAAPRLVVVSTEDEICRMADEAIRAIEGVFAALPSQRTQPQTDLETGPTAEPEPYPLETRKYLRILRWLQNEYQLCMAQPEVDEVHKASIEYLLHGCGYLLVDFTEGLEPYFELTPTTRVDRTVTTLPAIKNAITEEYILPGHAVYPAENND